MIKCEICGEEATIFGTGTIVTTGSTSQRSSRMSGSYCHTCMSQMVQDRNYPLLYKATKQQNDKKSKACKIAFVFFGHFDFINVNGDKIFLPTDFTKHFLKKYGKNDKIILVLLTDSFDEYWNDNDNHKGLYNQLKNICKKTHIDPYLINLLSPKLNSDESIIRYYRKILSDLIFLTGKKDKVSLFMTEGSPFGMDFIQLWYKHIHENKSAELIQVVYGAPLVQQIMFQEIKPTNSFGKNLKPDQEMNRDFVTKFWDYLKHYLNLEIER